MKNFLKVVLILLLLGCKPVEEVAKPINNEFVWENANLYFLLVDRFNNGDKSNDQIIKL